MFDGVDGCTVIGYVSSSELLQISHNTNRVCLIVSVELKLKKFNSISGCHILLKDKLKVYQMPEIILNNLINIAKSKRPMNP